MKKEKHQLTNIIPLGNNWASMPIGAMERIGVHFELLPKGKRPPKYTAQSFSLICEKIQKASLYGEGEQIGVEISVTELAQELTPPDAVKVVCMKTIYNGLCWLKENNWIIYNTGKDKKHRSVITINLEKVLQYLYPSDVKPKLNYDYQLEEWQRIIPKLGKSKPTM